MRYRVTNLMTKQQMDFATLEDARAIANMTLDKVYDIFVNSKVFKNGKREYKAEIINK